VNDIYVAEMRRDLMSWPGFNAENWAQAAQFCADHNINLEEALVWANKAIEEPFRGAVLGRREFSTLRAKASVLQAMHRTDEADAVMQEAIQLPGTNAYEINAYGSSLLAAGGKDKAMKVFQFNRQRFPDDQFVTYVGLARGYTALGDKAKAIESWEYALAHVPENRKGSVPRMKEALLKLKSSK
jgi:tetratricopeptide (TPR) repeat protein